ncbi:MAG: CoA transferase [Acidimicrobiales bacterium]
MDDDTTGTAAPPDAAREHLLGGLRVVVLGTGAVATAGRLLADLGADVVVDHGAGDDRAAADQRRRAVLPGADVVLVGDGAAVAPDVLAAAAPGAVRVHVTPFGRTGPRAGWRAGDLGVHAASGNLFCTGDPDRPPVRCTLPVAEAHTAPEAVVAALTALAAGAGQDVDLSAQEAVLVANLGAVGRYHREHDRGRRRGANIGRTREIWPCADGWVSFGIRGGRARVGTWTTVVDVARADGIDVSDVEGWDWATFDHAKATDDDLAALSAVVEAFCARRTTRELYRLACEHNLTLAPVNGPHELLADEQLAARDFFDDDGRPASVAVVRSPGDRVSPIRTRPRRPIGAVDPVHPWPDDRPEGGHRATGPRDGADGPDPGLVPGAWSGTTILELGTGAAGPVATRYFAEHGALVVRIESRSRPDFLRAYGKGLDAAPMFDALNPAKRSVALNLKHPEGRDLALALVDRADAVAENFAPKALRGLGLDYDVLAERRPDLVMLSACLNGQTGPNRDYPGFGSQGAALSGYTFLTGWADRPPIGPFGTITDSLAPRFGAALLAAGLLHRRRTGRGVHLDLSQVEAAVWSLTPWFEHLAATGEVVERDGNRHPVAVPHGVFPCRGDDRWLALAVHDDEDWERLVEAAGAEAGLAPLGATATERRARVDDVEAAVAAWTACHDATELAERLQAAGLEAVPVADLGDCHDDPQLAHRDHLVALDHPVLGEGRYERNGFRLADGSGGYDRASPLLGQDAAWVLGELLGIGEADQQRLREAGAVE